MKLRECFARLSLRELKTILVCCQGSLLQNLSDSELLDEMERRLADPQHIDGAFARLGSREKEILFRIHAENGDVQAGSLGSILGKDEPNLPVHGISDQSPISGLPGMRCAGLVFRILNTADEKYHYIVPYEVRKRIPGIIPDTKQFLGTAPPHDYLNWRIALLSDLFTVIRYLELYCVRPLKNGTIPKKNRNAILQKLNESNALIQSGTSRIYVDFLFRCSSRNTLIINWRNRLMPNFRLHKWMEKKPTEQLYDMYKSWRDDPTYDELYLAENIHIHSTGLRNPPRIIRNVILQSLKFFPAGQWISIKEFSRFIREYRPHFLRPILEDPHWTVQVSGFAADQRVEYSHRWTDIEEKLIYFIVFNYLTWLNIITPGTDTSGESTVFMITRVGAALLNNTPRRIRSDEEFEPDRLIVQPDFDLLAPKNTVLSVRYAIEKFAEFTTSGPMNQYRITRDSVIRGFEKGLSAADIIAFLQRHSGRRLPQNIAASLLSWEKQFGKITFDKKILMTVQDEFIMAELSSKPALKKFLTTAVCENTLEIDPGQLEELIDTLKHLGYFPRVTGGLKMQWDLAPVSLQLTLSGANTLFRFLEHILQQKQSPALAGYHGIERIFFQLKSTLEDLNSE